MRCLYERGCKCPDPCEYHPTPMRPFTKVVPTIPEFLAHLPVYGEYPVPFIVQYVGGKPDFRVVDMDKWEQCVNEKLCEICGKKLWEFSWIVGGPVTGETYLFFDPPMHWPCVQFASQACPYVSGRDRNFSDRPVGIPHDTMDNLQPRNSSPEIFLYKVRTTKVQRVRVQDKILLKAPRILKRIPIPRTP